MALLPKLRVLSAADYPDAPVWFRSFLDVLNDFLNDVQINLGANKVCWRTFTFNAATDIPESGEFSVTHDLKGRVDGVSVQRCEDLTTGGVITGAVWPNWTSSSDGNRVIIRYLTGLAATRSYRITLKIEQA